jgi:hypothetical protein
LKLEFSRNDLHRETEPKLVGDFGFAGLQGNSAIRNKIAIRGEIKLIVISCWNEP